MQFKNLVSDARSSPELPKMISSVFHLFRRRAILLNPLYLSQLFLSLQISVPASLDQSWTD